MGGYVECSAVFGFRRAPAPRHEQRSHTEQRVDADHDHGGGDVPTRERGAAARALDDGGGVGRGRVRTPCQSRPRHHQNGDERRSDDTNGTLHRSVPFFPGRLPSGCNRNYGANDRPNGLPLATAERLNLPGNLTEPPGPASGAGARCRYIIREAPGLHPRSHRHRLRGGRRIRRLRERRRVARDGIVRRRA